MRTPGTLVVSGDTANPGLNDHRVDWAKSGENYQSDRHGQSRNGRQYYRTPLNDRW